MIDDPGGPSSPNVPLLPCGRRRGLPAYYPGRADGHLAGDPLPRPLLPVSLFIDGNPAEILYAGDAPTLFEGVLQVNARIPANVRPGNEVPVVLKIDDKQSPPWVSVAIAPGP